MITLQDAIERARLGADEGGLLGSYLYDQIVQQLSEEDKYAFTMALVDLGIHTKLGTRATYQAVQKILAEDYYEPDPDEEDEEDEDEALIASFIKAAQAFRRQTPSGLWVPDSYETGDEAPQRSEPEPEKPVKPEEPELEVEESYYGEGEYESSFEYEEPEWSSTMDVEESEESLKEEPEEELGKDPEFAEISTDELVETLERSGILIDSKGNVRLYKQNIPGLYTENIKSWVPAPIEETIHRLNSEANAVDKEQGRISDLQDAVTLISKDFEAIDEGGTLKSYVPKFEEYAGKLEKFKYSETSKNPAIAEIARGISTLKQYLQPTPKGVKQVRNDILKLRPVLSNLQSKLDNYYQTQYEKYDGKLELINVLEKVQEVKEKSPEVYQQIVDDLGGITASMFIRAWDPYDWDEYGDHGDEPASPYGSLEIDVGQDYLKSFLGEDLFKIFMDQGGFESENFDDLRNELEGDFDLEYPEDDDEAGVKFLIVEGPDLKAVRGLWVNYPPDMGSGYPGGSSIDDHEALMRSELTNMRDLIEEDLQIFKKEYE